MDITGEYRLALSRDAVWAAFNDTDVLARCIPGCKELTGTAPEELAAKVALKIGPASATFAGTVRFEDVRAPEGYTLIGQGQGGMAGFAKGRAEVTLVELGGETVLTYRASTEIGGKIASLGAASSSPRRAST